MKNLKIMVIALFIVFATVAFGKTSYQNPNNYNVGATKTSSGVFFKVWAPNATAVSVVGDFNSWTTGTDQLINSNGYWSGLVAEATTGSLYKFRLTINGNIVEKFDPAARDTYSSALNSDNCDIVVDPTYNFQQFNSPTFNNYIIYQMHIGSFAGYSDGIDVGSDNIATFANCESKLDYVKALGFNAIELLPIQEFTGDRSWGYNPSFYFAPESAYGSPEEMRHFVNEAHKRGLSVIFDVVYNHASSSDTVMWEYDGSENIYFSGNTDWGPRTALWRQEVKDFFVDNAKMYFDEYKADGLRFDCTKEMATEGSQYITYKLREKYPSKILIAEHLGDESGYTVKALGYNSNWYDKAHNEFENIAKGDGDSINKLKSFVGWDGYNEHTNVVKYLLGSHDDCADGKNGKANGHRYMVELLGGRDNWYARAKTRMGWALNATIPGIPMLFMGSEVNMPGYWHDGSDEWGDHRFNWGVAGDWQAWEMRKLVTDANNTRWNNEALRTGNFQETQADYANKVYAFKRWNNSGNVILTVINMSDTDFSNHSYGVNTSQGGQWTQVLCSQDSKYGGWDGAGNAFYDPWTQGDGKIYINLPKWSVVVFRLK